MSDSTGNTDATVVAYRVKVPESDGTMLAAMRLGTYLAEEDSWIDTSIQLSDGFYLMTNAQTTTNVNGVSFLYSGRATSITGDKSIAATVAGESSFRARTVSFGANQSPSTVDASVNLEASDMVTLESGTGVTVVCDNLVYVVEQEFKNKTAGTSHSICQGSVSVALGGSISTCLGASFDIATVGNTTNLFGQSFAVFSISSTAADLSSKMCSMQNHGLKAFLCGMFLPLSEVEAEAVGVDSESSVASVNQSEIDSSEDGVQSDINVVSMNSNALTSNI